MNKKQTGRLKAAGYGLVMSFMLAAASAAPVWGADADSNSSSIMYGIGSTSKVIVTAAVMKLADEGRIDLDASLTLYIPEFEMADSRYRDITPRMLLNHTSGLPGSTLTNAMLLGESDTYNHDHLLEALKTQRLKADPGAYGTYCNDGFTLAEILVERVSQMEFTSYLEENFFKPLGLEQIKTPQSQLSPGSLAPIYDQYTGWELPPEHPNVIGSGGIYASAEDLCRFSQIYMTKETSTDTGAPLLSGNALAEMMESSYGRQLALEGRDTILEYGLGWDSVNTYPFNHYDIKALTKGGDTSYYHATLTVLPEEGISCAVLASGGNSFCTQISAQEILLDYLEEIGRIEREETQKQQILSSETPPSASTPAHASNIPDVSGFYDGNQIFKISVDKNGVLTLAGSEDQYSRPQTYLYQDDGRFHSSGGFYINAEGSLVKAGNGRTGRTTLEIFTTENGREYLMANIEETYPGLGNTTSYLPIASKLDTSSASHPAPDAETMEAWKQRDKKEYYLVSEAFSSAIYLTRFMVSPRLLEEPEGYLGFKDGQLTLARLTDPAHAEFFQQVPGQAGRDLNDYEIQEKQGREYLVTNSYRYISEDAVAPLPGHDAVITIGNDGEALWFYTTGASKNRSLVIETPENGSYFIYNHGSKDMSCVAGSYLSAPRQQTALPDDGRIVFAGEPGAEFYLYYQD